MSERLAAMAQRFTTANQEDALLWPTAEAAVGSYTCTEVDIPSRTFPQPPAVDLNTILKQIASSHFAETGANAAFWQRVRTTPPRPAPPVPTPIDGLPDVAPMLDSFQLAYNNLRELWSLVLPPQSLLGFKRLNALLAADFRMPNSLWASLMTSPSPIAWGPSIAATCSARLRLSIWHGSPRTSRSFATVRRPKSTLRNSHRSLRPTNPTSYPDGAGPTGSIREAVRISLTRRLADSLLRS
ncbi:hypothetical protein [Edaphobacter aggregans]|uniref:hypothetical protein n=1 Tax=Edaphobacter aggregans TaxID=570835 RepID=UPI000690EE8C|nr:hypothetical protein [Edaphobacter aggregans]